MFAVVSTVKLPNWLHNHLHAQLRLECSSETSHRNLRPSSRFFPRTRRHRIPRWIQPCCICSEWSLPGLQPDQALCSPSAASELSSHASLPGIQALKRVLQDSCKRGGL